MNVVGPKSFEISKREVWEAYKRVKAKRGGPGVDGVSIEMFEQDLSKNPYRIWNRMASGSYFHHPLSGWRSRRVMVGRGRWGSQRWQIGSHKWWFRDGWSRD